MSPTLALRFSDGERITTTAGHPFFVAGVGFVPAGRLAIGCQIVTRAGPALRLETEHPTGKLQTVYNFEVAGTHTYFVGKAGLWVHNNCEPEYLQRVWDRGNEDWNTGGNFYNHHSFPIQFDPDILDNGEVSIDNPSYRRIDLPGDINGKPGSYRLGGDPDPNSSNGLRNIRHRFFEPN